MNNIPINMGGTSSASKRDDAMEDAQNDRATPRSSSKKEYVEGSVPADSCSTDVLKRYTQLVPNLPPLRPSNDHAVLIDYNIIPGSVPLPFPKSYTDKWDKFHVRLPCSPQSLYPVKNAPTGEDDLQSRWGTIQGALSNNIQSTVDLEKAILTYNTEYSKQWNFTTLHKLFTEEFEHAETSNFFENVLPKMIDLCLKIPDICTQPIPLLQQGRNCQITLSQKQIASLLANAFFCTFPERKSSEYISYPSINFDQLYSFGSHTKIEKLKCLINYFRCVTADEPTGVVTFHRQCVKEFPKWRKSEKELTNLCIQSKGLIEVDGKEMLQIDFADEFIGGLVIDTSDCAQEEVLFLIYPELIVSRLFTEQMDKNEAFIATGFERFNKYTGYEQSFRWDGNFEDCIPRDPWGRRLNKVAAIDAIPFSRTIEQYQPKCIRRELNKAFAGFSEPALDGDTLPAVATGNWGCGVFHGDPRLKALIQLISASVAGRDLLYLTFNDKQLECDVRKVYGLLKSKNVKAGQLVRILEDFNEKVSKPKGNESLYPYLIRRCLDSGSKTCSQD